MYAEPGTVVSVTVNGENITDKDKYYPYDSEVVIKYGEYNRDNVALYLKDWRNTPADVIKTALISGGYTNVRVSEETVYNQPDVVHNSIEKIILNHDYQYDTGDYYTYKDKEIVIYSKLSYISTGKNPSDYIGKTNVDTLVNELIQRGFVKFIVEEVETDTFLETFFIYFEPNGYALCGSGLTYTGNELKWEENPLRIYNFLSEESGPFSHEGSSIIIDFNDSDPGNSELQNVKMVFTKIKDESTIKKYSEIKNKILEELYKDTDDKNYLQIYFAVDTALNTEEVKKTLGLEHCYQIVISNDGVIISYDKQIIKSENVFVKALIDKLGTDFDSKYKKKVNDGNSYTIEIDSEGNINEVSKPYDAEKAKHDDYYNYMDLSLYIWSALKLDDVKNTLGEGHSYKVKISNKEIVILYDNNVVNKDNKLWKALVDELGEDFYIIYRKKVPDNREYVIDVDSDGNIDEIVEPDKP